LKKRKKKKKKNEQLVVSQALLNVVDAPDLPTTVL